MTAQQDLTNDIKRRLDKLIVQKTKPIQKPATKLVPLKLTLTATQIKKIQEAIAKVSEVSFRLAAKDIHGRNVILVPRTTFDKVKKNARNGNGTVIKISKTRIRKAMSQDGSNIFSSLIPMASKLVVPAATTVAKTVLPALAQGAAMTLGSLGLEKLFGRGHKGGQIDLEKMSKLLTHLKKPKEDRDLAIMKLFGGEGTKPGKAKVLEFLSRLVPAGRQPLFDLLGRNSLGKQKGGFLGTLAASIGIPMLLNAVGKIFGRGKTGSGRTQQGGNLLQFVKAIPIVGDIAKLFGAGWQPNFAHPFPPPFIGEWPNKPNIKGTGKRRQRKKKLEGFGQKDLERRPSF